MSDAKFPDKFLWGSATAAHQVEGNNTLNDWHQWEEQGHIADGQRSGLACDHYNRFREDIDLLVGLNQKAYRFSVEWSRIEPERGQINREAIAHYAEVLTYLREKGVKSFVTLHHFTNPVWFDWEREDAVEAFAGFASLIAKELGSQIDFWCTINEPNILAKHGYLEGDFPPGRRSMMSQMRVLDNLIAGHNAAYEAIHAVLPEAAVGMAKNNGYYHPASTDALDVAVTELNRAFRNFYFLDRVQCDFIGINYYSPKKLRFAADAPNSFYGKKVDSGLPKTDMGWEIQPDGLFEVLMELKKYGKPVYITENGLADAHDVQRRDFLRGHLLAVHRAIAAGLDVRGYIYWSLMDNFEWGYGYGPRFGLIEIDYATQRRTVRESAKWFAEVCRNNAV